MVVCMDGFTPQLLFLSCVCSVVVVHHVCDLRSTVGRPLGLHPGVVPQPRPRPGGPETVVAAAASHRAVHPPASRRPGARSGGRTGPGPRPRPSGGVPLFPPARCRAPLPAGAGPRRSSLPAFDSRLPLGWCACARGPAGPAVWEATSRAWTSASSPVPTPSTTCSTTRTRPDQPASDGRGRGATTSPDGSRLCTRTSVL